MWKILGRPRWVHRWSLSQFQRIIRIKFKSFQIRGKEGSFSKILCTQLESECYQNLRKITHTYHTTKVTSCLITDVEILNEQSKRHLIHQKCHSWIIRIFSPEMQGWFSKTVSIYKFTILIHLRRTHIILIEMEDHLNTMILFSNNS